MSIELKQYAFNVNGEKITVNLQNYRDRRLLWHITHITPNEIREQGGIKCNNAEFELHFNGFEIITKNCVALAENQNMCFQVIWSKLYKINKLKRKENNHLATKLKVCRKNVNKSTNKDDIIFYKSQIQKLLKSEKKDKYQDISDNTIFYLYAIDSKVVEESLYYFENLSGDKEFICKFIPVDCIPFYYFEHNYPGSCNSSLLNLELGNIAESLLQPYWNKHYDLTKTLFLKTLENIEEEERQKKIKFYLSGDNKTNIKNIISGSNWNRSTHCFVQYIQNKYIEEEEIPPTTIERSTCCCFKCGDQAYPSNPALANILLSHPDPKKRSTYLRKGLKWCVCGSNPLPPK